jgi:hypothetical protein
MNNKEEILTELQGLIATGKKIQNTTYNNCGIFMCEKSAFVGWKSNIIAILQHFALNKTEHFNVIRDCKSGSIYPKTVDEVIQQLNGLVQIIQKDFVNTDSVSDKPTIKDLENIFNKFTRVVRQLRSRHDNRGTLIISDEYDVQDLLHALLILHFDDVRAEEWTPSYAGGCERMDFLLKDLQTVIEVKKTRSSMSKKDLGEELIIDIEKYKSHPGCKQLYCFVYDPDGFLGNPNAIKNDLETAHKGFVKIFIRPEI